MKVQILVLATVLMVVPWAAATASAEAQTASEDELKAAHEALREAVETIRKYHMEQGGPQGAHVYHKMGGDFTVDTGRPRMGIVVQSVGNGVEIAAVTPGGPADEAGLETGDVLTRINDVDLTDGSGRPHGKLIEAVRGLEEGETVVVEYLRDGDEGSAVVAVRPLEFDFHVSEGMIEGLGEGGPHHVMRFGGHGDWHFPHGWLDMELVALNPDLAEYFGTDEGVLVVRAPDDGEIGLKGGDVIVSIGDRVVKSPTHALRILRSYEPEETAEIEVIRHGRNQIVETTIPEHSFRVIETYKFRHDEDHD
jgi:S1-C subfamily serine protease